MIRISLYTYVRYVFLFFLVCIPLIFTNKTSLSSRDVPNFTRISVVVSTPGALTETYLTHLPALYKSLVKHVTLDYVWTTNPSGIQDSIHNPGEIISLFGRGVNNSGGLFPSLLTWSTTNECGSTNIYSETVSLAAGTWTDYYTITVPECLGVYTYSLHVDNIEATSTLTSELLVVNPSEVIVSSQQGFDKCNIPTIDQMQTWWNHSPYYSINLYIGGISRSCDNLELNANWVLSVNQQGWSFIPTWVGPQAPCSSFPHKMSSDPSIAYLEGRTEAELADKAAHDLGFQDEAVIYYDLEAFGGASETCRLAAKSFIKGWVERLHDLDLLAGVYGGACSSYIVDWATISPVPDDIWIASWYTDTYDPEASVWDVPCVPQSLWSDHQRIRQYAGTHKERWNNLSMTIDSNALDGEITSMSVNLTFGPYLPNNPTIIVKPNIIQSMQLLSPDQGWVFTNNAVLWTEDSGSSWVDISPQDGKLENILSGYFLNMDKGFLVANSPPELGLVVYSTSDGGKNWNNVVLIEDSTVGQSAFLFYLNEQTGWISIRLPSSSNFNLGRLFKTNDGWTHWEEVSSLSGGRIYFIDENLGWMVGGAEEDELLQTSDGGNSWIQATSTQIIDFYSIKNPDLNPPNSPVGISFINSDIGWTLIQENECHGDKTIFSDMLTDEDFICEIESRLYRTVDGGKSWVDITP